MTAVSGTDIDGALADLASNAVDPWLAGCRPRTKGDRLTLFPGGVARVYPVMDGNRTYALRFWTAAPDGLEERYRHFASFQERVRVPCLVDALYLARALRVHGMIVPAVRMEWVDGQPLGRFLDAHHQRAAAVEHVAARFADAVRALHAHGCSHGDLQDGNILVEGRGVDLSVRLVDYDTFHLPSLGARHNEVTALPDYQHPSLPASPIRSAADDHFSELVIYLSLRAIAQDPTLWRPGTDSRLILTRADYLEPDTSPTFARLLSMGPEIRRLTETLQSFCSLRDIRHIPPLEAVLEQRAALVSAYFGMEAMRRMPPAGSQPGPPPATPAPPAPTGQRTPLPPSFDQYFGQVPARSESARPSPTPVSSQTPSGPVPPLVPDRSNLRVPLLLVLLLILAAVVAIQLTR